MKKRPIKSLKYAERRIRYADKLINFYKSYAERLTHERNLLALLAAEGPAFTDVAAAAEAKQLRNEILRSRFNMNPDGTFIKSPVQPTGGSR